MNTHTEKISAEQYAKSSAMSFSCMETLQQKLCEYMELSNQKNIDSGKLCIFDKKRHRCAFNKYFKRGKSALYKLNFEVRNHLGTCQCQIFVVHQLLLRVLNPQQNFNLYVSNGRPLFMTLQTMSYAVMEDLAIYALAGKNLDTPQQRQNCFVTYRRRQLSVEAFGIAEQQIRRFWPQFIYKGRVHVAWYIFLCSAIQRVHGINVLAGTGKEFILAYTSIVNGQVEISESPVIVQHPYYAMPVMPQGTYAYTLASKRDESGHIEIVLHDDQGFLAYFNNQEGAQFTSTGTDTHLMKACKAMVAPLPFERQGKHRKSFEYGNFSKIKSPYGKYVMFYDSGDYLVYLS